MKMNHLLARFARLVLASVVLGGLVACTGGAHVVPEIVVPFRPLTDGQSYAPDKARSAASLGQGKSRIVIYSPARVAESGARTPLNIYIDGRFQASLLPGAYTEQVICSAGFHLNVVPGDVIADYTAREMRGQPYRPTGEPAYFRVSADSAGASVSPVDRLQAQSELARMERQVHTISRVVPECASTPGEEAKSPEVVGKPSVEIFMFSAEALFRFDGYRIGDMLPEGKAAIADLAAKLGDEKLGLKRIRIVGHTDPLGGPAYNLQLSRRRAETVAKALVQAGVSEEIVQTEGLGQSRPIVSACSGTLPEQRACYQPNRRVEVVVEHGAR